MDLLRVCAISFASLLFIAGISTTKAQTQNKKELIEQIKKATKPVATTNLDSDYNSHYADLTIAKEYFAKADTSILPATKIITKNWSDYTSAIKGAFRQRRLVRIHVLQTYTSMDNADRQDMVFSKVLAEKMLAVGFFTTVAVDQLWADSLTIDKATSQTLSFLGNRDGVSPSDSAEVRSMLTSLNPAIRHYSSNKNNIHIVGASTRALTDLSKQILENEAVIPPLDLHELRKALATVRAEMAIASAINTAVKNNDDRVALVVNGSMGASIYDIAEQRGYQAHFYWAAKRTKEIEKIFSLK